ncbi:MAG: NAD-dependent epimerase/dehydratase family protein [Nanoarchaeota archaeon]|nr:NAD-dependent epimerase/dehydratase family protein [Nanoarchaeota archaeon]
MRVLVTGGAGFIGSHMVDELLSRGHQVLVYDNNPVFLNEKAELVKADILDFDKLKESLSGVDKVYHFAADPDVRGSVNDPGRSFEINVKGTWNVLEAMRLNDVKRIGFASSGGTVYGETKVFPTPETEVFKPISPYGATKVCGEAYLSTYAHSYGMTCVAFRYANIIGPRLTHGVIFDFYNKLKKNPKELEILGDGKQCKSYLHVSDCVKASIHALENSTGYAYYNKGSEEWITVDEIARTIIETMGLKNVELKHTGGSKGWTGDVVKMLLDINKLKKLGFEPEHSIKKAIEDTVNWLIQNR